MDIKDFRRKLKRYLKGTANETESAIVEAWYQSYQRSEETGIDAGKRPAVKNAIRQKINRATATRVVTLRCSNYGIAAGLLLIAGIALFFAKKRMQVSTDERFTLLQTRAGEVKQIVPPDSSVMWVNAMSRVRIPAAFNGSIRYIVLDDGEVFLRVRHDHRKPFRVTAHTLQVQVLGTSFNVKAYASSRHASVAVATGKVAVRAAGRTLSLLSPGQELIFDEQTTAFKQHNIDIAATQAWKDGETYLNQASFGELSLVLKNNFGIELKAANRRVEQYQFTLRLKCNIPADEALKVVSLIHNTHFRRRGNEVVLY